jgi:hypothetical protein
MGAAGCGVYFRNIFAMTKITAAPKRPPPKRR